MCRSIKTLRPPVLPEEATEEEIRAAALQYVRKVSGFRAPAAHNREVFEHAVEAIAVATADLLGAWRYGVAPVLPPLLLQRRAAHEVRRARARPEQRCHGHARREPGGTQPLPAEIAQGDAVHGPADTRQDRPGQELADTAVGGARAQGDDRASRGAKRASTTRVPPPRESAAPRRSCALLRRRERAMARSRRSPPRQARRYATRSPATDAVTAQRVSARMSGASCGTAFVAEPAAAAVAAVMTRTPLGRTGRKTSRRTDAATTA